LADYSARPPTLLWAFLGLDGRIGREVFWLGYLESGLLAYLILHPYWDENGFLHFDNIGLSPLVFACVGWVVLALAVKRLHDISMTGWLAGLVFVPFVGVIPFLAIGAIAGTRGPNPYGPATNRRGSL
jgi:uncharacterized membrane protein YhaH (DUF805 family)